MRLKSRLHHSHRRVYELNAPAIWHFLVNMLSLLINCVPALLICTISTACSFQSTPLTTRTACRLISMGSKAATSQDIPATPERRYLSIPFDLKDEAKALGAVWDPVQKSWFNPDPVNNAQLDQLVIASKSVRRYLSVSYADKDEAKSLGARWDADQKLWFNPHPTANPQLNKWEMNREEVSLKLNKLEMNREEVSLKGEDRTFGGNLLFVDLIPSSCWFTNVRSSVHSSDWDRLRKKVYSRASDRCECCGSSNSGLEAHERWKYDYPRKIQKLMRLVALCRDCHRSTHMGLASVQGKEKEAKEHLRRMRMFSIEEVENHIDEAFELFEERSKFKWELDLSILISNGIKLNEIPLSKVSERR